MTVPSFSFDEFLAYLRTKGVTVASDEFFEDYKRLILKKGNNTFPFPVQKMYFYPQVVKFCEGNDIPPPENHKRVYDQYADYEKSKREDEEGAY